MAMRPPLRFLSLATLALLALAGCASGPTAASRDANPFARLALGMTVDEVRTLVGAPRSIRPDPAGGAGDEFWHYRRKQDEMSRQVSTGTRDVPAVNPLTGEQIIIQEPVMGNESAILYLDVELKIINGRLMSIHVSRNLERTTAD